MSDKENDDEDNKINDRPSSVQSNVSSIARVIVSKTISDACDVLNQSNKRNSISRKPSLLILEDVDKISNDEIRSFNEFSSKTSKYSSIELREIESLVELAGELCDAEDVSDASTILQDDEISMHPIKLIKKTNWQSIAADLVEQVLCDACNLVRRTSVFESVSSISQSSEVISVSIEHAETSLHLLAHELINQTFDKAYRLIEENRDDNSVAVSSAVFNEPESEDDQNEKIDFMDIEVEKYIGRDLDESEREAFELVDRALKSAIRGLEEEMTSQRQRQQDKPTKVDRTMFLSKEGPVNIFNVQWPTISEFSENLAIDKIDEFILTWNLSDEWLYCIDYIGVLETRFDQRFRFRARFSIPTSRKPVPYASASVYFTMVASKIKPKNNPVEVLYVVETNRLIHKPGEYKFCELWLRRVLESKYLIMDMINF